MFSRSTTQVTTPHSTRLRAWHILYLSNFFKSHFPFFAIPSHLSKSAWLDLSQHHFALFILPLYQSMLTFIIHCIALSHEYPSPYVHMRLNAPHDIFCFTYYVVGQNGRLLRYSPHLFLTSIYHLWYLFTLFITMNLPVWVANSVLYLLCSISSFNVFCTYVVSIKYFPLS